MNLICHRTGNPNRPAIVFLHGAGVSSWMWTDQIEALSDRYYCIAIDLPGSGESYQVEWISFKETARQIKEIINAEAVGSVAHVVGLSLGGYTALHLLTFFPEVVETMIVSGVTSQPFPNLRFYNRMVQLMSRILKWDPVIWLNRKMLQIPDEVADVYRRDSKRMSPVMLRRIYAEVLPYELPASIGESKPHLLAVAGEKEANLIINGLDRFKIAGPNSQAALAPDAHHGWNGEYPELFTEMVEAWIARETLPATLNVLSPATQQVLPLK